MFVSSNLECKTANPETRTHSVFSVLFALACSQHLLPCVSSLNLRRRCPSRLSSTADRAVCPTSFLVLIMA